jgi:diguanylate cyclase (GGDEF)-like protein
MGIHSYVGVPLSFGDGKLFGTLCAIDRQPQPETLNNELPLLELLAAMLSGILDKELAATEAARHAERLQAEAETDALTGLFNRRGWDRVLDAEDARCRRYGHPACVIAVDLDGLKAVNDFHGHAAGDKLIFDAGAAIKSAARESDVVARVGGDEFAILAVESDTGACRQLQHRIDSALARAGIEASLGLAMRHPMKGFSHAWQQADRAMYAVKASKPPRYRGALAATLSLTSPRVN